MFYNCSGLTSLNINNFNTAKVTGMNQMFQSCSSLTSLDFTKAPNFNTAAVQGMSWMFRDCVGLTALNVSSFNTSEVTDMSGMFAVFSTTSGTPKLTSLDLSNFDTSKVETMYQMFYKPVDEDASFVDSLSSLNLSSFDTSSVTDMDQMFTGCNVLKTVTLGEKFDFDTSVESCFLPTPSSVYITDADGNWYDTETGSGFTPADQATYHNNLDKVRKYSAIAP